MRIVCPSCAAAYDVPEGLLSGRNAVRCARCATEWQPTRPEPAPIPVAARRDPPTPPRPIPDARLRPPPRPADPAAPKAIDRLMATPQRRQRAGLALSIAWLGSILLVAALLGAGYVERAQVMAVWPPSIRLYAALGLAGPLP
jgi:predicted Zn finger-like uncharacterized protein